MSGSKEEVMRKEWQIEVTDALCVNAVDIISPSKLNQPMNVEMIGVEFQQLDVES